MSDITFGRYRILRELGRGAMGVVYEAHDPDRGMEVALKVLAVAASASPETRRRRVERFYREAQALAELNHPHIVRIFDQGELEGRYYFTMEVVRGTTLRDRLQFQGPLSLPELTRLALELCDALEHIHGRGVIHRDIKPENIMLMPDGSAKLMDFGVAELVTGGGASSGGFHGSPAYMSPEQVAGQAVDGRSDLYSLGVTLYEAATGRRAVEGEHLPEILRKVAEEMPPPPPGLPPYFQSALMRALAKHPAARYARARDMAEDLRARRVRVEVCGPLPAGAGKWTAVPPHPPGPAARPPHRVDFSADPPGGPLPELAAGPGLASPAGPGLASPAGPGLLSPAGRCAAHPAKASVGVCVRCARALCYACMLEVPGRGLLCRGCAFGG